MSNPGVITLSTVSKRNGKFKRFVIEDNLGESVHLHIDNMRVDFTINEFLEFSKIHRKALKEIEILPGYSIENFDENFLMEISHEFPRLISIKIEEIRLSELRCIVTKKYRGLSVKKILPIEQTPVYKYLSGISEEFENYDQYNYFGVSNKKRVNCILQSIQKHKYPYKDKYIILTSGQNLIRDGQHRAAVLCHLLGKDCKVKVMRFMFDGSGHHVNVIKSNIFRIFKWFLLAIYRRLR